MGFDHAQRSPNLKRFVLLVSSLVTGSVCYNVFLLLKEELRRETLASLQHMEKAEFSAKFGSGGPLSLVTFCRDWTRTSSLGRASLGLPRALSSSLCS